jgi:hypothetical protein
MGTPNGRSWHIRDVKLWSGSRLEADIQKSRGSPLPFSTSRSCNVVDPSAEQVGNFQAAGKIVIFIHEFLVLVL